MLKLKGTNIQLRALEPEDLNFLYQIENNENLWEVSNTQTPYSRFLLKQYLENAHLDIYEAKQLRLAIENNQGVLVGLIDLFDFNPQHLRAGIGILIAPEHQQKGYALQAIQLAQNYAFSVLNLQQVYANIDTKNKQSIHLFEKLGYQYVGTRKNWIYNNHAFKDVAFYQLIYPSNIS
ncbi:GNAT family N-acetyltransferase [Wenyingzhuangia sp. 2_MG-2023]|uniref:GNAT family N-acetyltransferase n=1 Tax=Wenyingzhuangia sp. 2_MG-2023 TaxID=3062639 RepID=UPI0026E48166|nr:GNAT family N-acetyltransferase [Wenyingzhuangia sp. 2_MG-2023]MDO6736955.1 GNAT family N-acetyltransferase [Wenyingzhuangia sp. 2_MG-2023]MDO6801875.1 GNAT family N-acetyltransferase [Wenyingzhuangia sp. 1_MG-2023]